MVKKSTLIISILSIISLAYIVMAASGDGVKMMSPSSGSNYTSITGVLFNVSYTNLTDIGSPTNASFFINLSGTWVMIGNTSNTGCTTTYCSATITNTTIPDGVYSINATLYNNTASISTIHLENLSNIIYIDNSVPLIFIENFSSPSSNSNRSQKIILNISAIDATIGVQSVVFNITNATSGLQNSTVTATRESTTSNYAVEINTSHYPDGHYNITAYVNDSLGNLNNSARVGQIIFDNTKPYASFTCDDYVVEEDDEMNCDCSSSDALSGVASEDFDSTPSTSNTGTNFEEICTVTDRAGNINTSTIYYNVTSGSSATGGSSGGSSSGGTTGGSTGGSNSSLNSTNQSSNQSNNNANQLQGNQENLSNQNKIKINYGVLIGIIVGAAIIVSTIAFLRKKNLLFFKK